MFSVPPWYKMDAIMRPYNLSYHASRFTIFYKTRRGNHRLMISPSHFPAAVASGGGQATVTDRLVYVLFTWWDGLAPSCFAGYWFHLWLNLRLPPDAGGIVQNATGFSPCSQRGFRRCCFIPFKEPHLVAVVIAHLVRSKINAKNNLSRVLYRFVFTSFQPEL